MATNVLRVLGLGRKTTCRCSMIKGNFMYEKVRGQVSVAGVQRGRAHLGTECVHKGQVEAIPHRAFEVALWTWVFTFSAIRNHDVYAGEKRPRFLTESKDALTHSKAFSHRTVFTKGFVLVCFLINAHSRGSIHSQTLPPKTHS